jgi:hypothetical protein
MGATTWGWISTPGSAASSGVAQVEQAGSAGADEDDLSRDVGFANRAAEHLPGRTESGRMLSRNLNVSAPSASVGISMSPILMWFDPVLRPNAVSPLALDDLSA